MVVISGGGSVAYGRNAAGQESRVGGWGHLLGDEGSGYWIGLEAARAALRSSAGVIPLTTLERAVWASLEVADSGELTQRVYSGAVTDRDLALLVPVVEREAAGGDEAARGILDRAAGHLFALVRAAVARLGPLPVYPSGGAFRVEGLRERFERLASGAGLEVRLAREGSDPMDGLLIIARHGPAYVVGG